MLNAPLPAVGFAGFAAGASNFDATMQGLRSKAFHWDVDLSAARAAGNMLMLPIAGNVLYIDQKQNAGNARIHFQDQTPSSTPITVYAGFLIRIPFTQIAIENDAQPGTTMRIIFGVDLDFVPSSAAGLSLLNPVSVLDGGRARTLAGTAFTVGLSSVPVAAQKTMTGIQNPAGNTKNTYVKSFGIGTDLATQVSLFWNNAPLTNLLANVNRSKNGGAAAGVTESRYDNGAAFPAGNNAGCMVILGANGFYSAKFDEPFLLTPGGKGLFWGSSVVNLTLSGYFEIMEDV